MWSLLWIIYNAEVLPWQCILVLVNSTCRIKPQLFSVADYKAQAWYDYGSKQKS
jgi:hypothetical protein